MERSAAAASSAGSPSPAVISAPPVAENEELSSAHPTIPASPSLAVSEPQELSGQAASPSSDTALHLRLKTLDERVFDVYAAPSMSVVDFRAEVAQVTSVPAQRQRLIYRGKLLKDGTVLSAYDLQDGHTVHLVAKPEASQAVSPTGSRQETPQQTTRPTVVTRRRQPQGELTGNAWNLAVLREALNGPTEESTEVRNRPLPMLREILDEMNESPQGTAARMGLGNLPANVSRTDTNSQQPVVDLEPITQGILTVRTVLSTAAVEEAQEQQDEGERVEEERIGQEEATSVVHRGQRQFFVGQWLDVKDTVNQWLESTVMDIADGKVLIHYHGWPTRWDEWIDFDSDRIAAFRTRTLHTQSNQRMSPVPTTRVPSAPRVGGNDVRRMVVDVRNLMREMMPHIDRLAELCEEDLGREQSSDSSVEQNADASDAPARGQSRNNEVSEMAHLVAPLFDRFGRLLMDSVGYLDPLLRPELRGTSQRQQERHSTALRYGNGGGAPQRQGTSVGASMEAHDSSLAIRDLIATSPHTPGESTQPRRSIDVHIHAIVAPASLSSFASLTRGASGTAGTQDTASTIRRPHTPTPRPLFDFGESTNADDHTTHEDDGDSSRVPLLGSYRHRSHSSTRESGQQQRSVSRDLDEFLSDDFFGTSFGHDDDDNDSDDDSSSISFSHSTSSHTVQAAYTPPSPSIPVSSPRTPRSDDYPGTPTSSIGVIPEIAEAEERRLAREADLESAQQTQTDGRTQRASSDSSGSSSGFPTFLEVMRRTLSGVRNFVHSDSNERATDETSPPVELVSSFSLPSSPSSSPSSSSSTPPLSSFHSNGQVASRSRVSSDASSVQEDLDEVD